MPTGYCLIIASEFVCAVFMGFIFMGLSVSKLEKEKTTFFRWGVIATFLALIIDALSYLSEAIRISDLAIYCIDAMSYLVSSVIVFFIGCYIIAEVKERRKFGKVHFFVILGFCIADVIILLIGLIAGKLFTVENGVVTYTPLASISGVVLVIGLAYIELIVLLNAKILGKRFTIILTSYQFIPFLTLVLQVFIYPELPFIYVTTSFSNMLIYVMILSREVLESHTKEQLIAEVSVLDLMTGLKNRNAFDKALSEVVEDDLIGIVSCDINALKEFNDLNGVEAGNGRIMLVSDLLRRSFESGSIYRISGDGFSVIVRNARKVEFEGLVNTFIRKVSINGFVAAVGSAYGHGKDVYRLISESETVMRADKLGFYQNRNTRGNLS